MVLNYIWIAFFLIAFIVALIRLLFYGDTEVFQKIIDGTFESSKTAFEISIGLTGIMSLWLGVMKIGEDAGLIRFFAKVVGPFFNRLFPEVPKNHPAIGNVLMNFSANMLGLDNAATPLGLKAMKELQDLNPDKETASNAQIMFLVLNTAGLTLIPVTVLMYRAQFGAANPSDVFIPILLATFFGTISGLLAVAAYQRINLLDKVLLAGIGGFVLFLAFITYYFSTLSQEELGKISQLAANVIIFTVIAGFILAGLVKKINVYEVFIEGAKDGFFVAVKIIPYLVAILVGISVFRASGAMDFLVDGIALGFMALGINTDFVPALPIGFMKALSGSGARGLMIDALKTYGADSFVGRLSCIIQGSTDTTFYILAVYFGSVGIRKTRYALTCGLIADLCGFIAAVLIAYLFFH